MTISKDIWSIIFQHLHVEHFLNAMLTEKAAYEGFKLHASPTLILRKNERDIETYLCQLCYDNQYTRGDEVNINYETPLSSVDLSSPCCRYLVCPKCPRMDEQTKTTTFHYLFIKDVIYLQHDDVDEEEPISLDTNCIQYMWVPSESFPKSILKNYSVVDDNYNSFTSKKIEAAKLKSWAEDNRCYTDVCVRCECKYCGFECSARNYMDS